MTGPLDGVRVIDITTVVLGPYATQILGDFGADVIKVETPDGDVSRRMTPGRRAGMSGVALTLHRNKRSIALDLKTPGGAEALRRLIASADVLVHNMRPAAIGRLGFGYDAVAAIKPDIVYVAAVGFGQHGPYAPKAAYDDIVQGVSGLADLQGRHVGRPVFVTGAVVDKITAQATVQATLAALFHKARTGEGQYVEVPMFETAISFAMAEHGADGVFDPPLTTFGYRRMLTEYRRPYRASDGYVCVLPYTNKQFQSFYAIAERPDLAADPVFGSFEGRAANIGKVYATVEELVATKTVAEWVAACDQTSIPCMPVKALDELLEDEHTTAVGLFQSREHPTEGAYRAVDTPTRFAKTPTGFRRHAPELGADGAEVLRELGYDSSEIAELRAAGALHGAGE